VAIELMVLIQIFTVTRFFRLRAFAIALLLITAVHIGLATANLIFFKERYQHLWEMLIANISRPGEIIVAVQPFAEAHPAASALAVVLIAALVIAAVRLCRRIPPMTLDLWKPIHVRQGFVIVAVLVLVNLDPVAHRTTKHWGLGWIPLPTASQFYMRYDNYEANQAVINPVHDLIRFFVPATVAGIGTASAAHLEAGEAISISQTLLGVRPLRQRYPLMQNLPAGPQLGLKNVIVIMVEGLSRSILHRTEENREITPFLNDLAQRGLSFANIIQSYNATDGSVFSAVTGMHKTYVNENWQYFLPTEVNSYFGSIANLLGRERYRHFAMFGFHNRRQDFTAFLRNQGFETFDITHFSEAMGDKYRPEEAGNALGLFDHVLFEETEKILLAGRSPFTALVITATTHSPWVVAHHFPKLFANSQLNAFRYLDDSIRDFVSSLRAKLNGLDDTLIVITGDHTSMTFGGGHLERLRVPLIFYSPRLERLAGKLNANTGTFGSHVDIVPTILQLIDGAHSYSGMGVSLLSPNRANARVISSSRFGSLYLRDGYALEFSPASPGTQQTQLFAIKDGEIAKSDVSSSEPALMKRMQREFFALYETSAKLMKEKRIFPFPPDGRREHAVNR
jgi:hypothetical protein